MLAMSLHLLHVSRRDQTAAYHIYMLIHVRLWASQDARNFFALAPCEPTGSSRSLSCLYALPCYLCGSQDARDFWAT